MRALTWALLYCGGIAAHLTHPKHTISQDGGIQTTEHDTQQVFDNVGENPLESVFLDTAVAGTQGHKTAQPLATGGHDFARRAFRFAKRQAGGEPSSNTTIGSPATTSVTTEPESVSPSTSPSSVISSPPSSSSGGENPSSTSSGVALPSSESVHPSAAVTVTSTIASTIASTITSTITSSPKTATPSTLTPSGGDVVQQSPTSYRPTTSTSTSTVFVPVSSTMTQTVTSTLPPTAAPTTANPTTIVTSQTTSQTAPQTAISTQTKTMTSSITSTSGSASGGSSAAPTLSSSSFVSSVSSGVTAGIGGQSSFVLVTSTLSDGSAVTLTSFVGAATDANGGQGGSPTSPSGSLQSPSKNTAHRSWSIGISAGITVLAMVVVL